MLAGLKESRIFALKTGAFNAMIDALNHVYRIMYVFLNRIAR